MTDKSLKAKAIQIKGKDYVLVSDRVLYFNETYPNGAIITERVESDNPQMEVIKAVVIPDVKTPERRFTGYSQAIRGDWYINKTSALENAETSAVGRALAFMGIGVIESIASVDEIKKTTTNIYTKKEIKPKMDTEAFEKAKKHLKDLDLVQWVDALSKIWLKYSMTPEQFEELDKIANSVF